MKIGQGCFHTDRPLPKMIGKEMKQMIGMMVFIYGVAVFPFYAHAVEEYPLDLATLEKGELQIFTEEFKVEGEGKKKRVAGVILINRPPQEVWAVIKNWDAMGQFVPGLDYYKTLHVITPIDDRNQGETVIEGKLDVPLISVTYTVAVTFRTAEKNRIEWRLIDKREIAELRIRNIQVKDHTAGLKNIEGFGYLEPYDNGSKTIYTYAPVVEISIPVPAFVERSISKSSLKGYLKAVKARVESKKQNP